MCNPDVPDEVLVMGLNGMYSENHFVIGKIEHTEVTLAISYFALQRLFAYAIKAGIVGTDETVYYRTKGKHRRYISGKHTPKGTKASLGTR